MGTAFLHYSASSVEQRTALKARLADLAHFYCDSTIDSHDFPMHKECFRAINRIQKNDDIITKPAKGSGVVLLNKSDYVDKMNDILYDQSKFKRLGSVSSNDSTTSIKLRLQKRLLHLVKADLMPKWIYDAIRPTGSQKPRTYDLPKTHKQGAPPRPILSMTGSSHHELGRWLAGLLQRWSGFRHIAFQIRLHLPRPSKIYTSTLMSSCVLLMCSTCSPTFPLMKLSKSVRKPSMANLILVAVGNLFRFCFLNTKKINDKIKITSKKGMQVTKRIDVKHTQN